MDERHLRAEGRPRLRHLDTDDAAAEDREPRRHLLGGRRLDVRPGAGIAQAVDVGDQRARPGRDDHGLARDELLAVVRATFDDDPALAVEARAATHERDAVLLEPRQLARVVEVRDHLVAPREHGRHVDRPDREPGHALDLTLELDRTQECLRGHAGVVRALAADEPVLDDRDRDPVLAQPAGHDLAGDAGPHHHHVELAHGASLGCQDARFGPASFVPSLTRFDAGPEPGMLV